MVSYRIPVHMYTSHTLLPEVDTGLLRGEGILQDYAQYACANDWPRPLSTSHDGWQQCQGKKILLLSSDFIEIIAKSPNSLCIFCILWTKGRSLVQGGNYWSWGGGMCPVFPTPGSAPASSLSLSLSLSLLAKMDHALFQCLVLKYQYTRLFRLSLI